MKDLNYYIEKYPKLVENIKLNSIPSGWDQIFLDVMNAASKWLWLDAKLQKTVTTLDYVTLTQVKEKFGSIRIYYKLHTPPHDHAGANISARIGSYIDGIITYAEVLASKTCQICSAPATLELKEYTIATMCDKCSATFK